MRRSELAREIDAEDDDEDYHSLVAWPEHPDLISVLMHLILLPLKFMVWVSTPDVRRDGRKGEEKYALCIVMCFFWLIALSYLMASCVELLGDWLHISSMIMGMTVSAAGTSFPNVFASIIVARQGLGNMAVSNALGGNVFNIFMGLGLPWLLYCLLSPSFSGYMEDGHRFMYFGMRFGGVLFPVVILLVLMVGNLVLLLATGWKLYKSHAYVFIVIYLVFLVWVFAGAVSPF
jgi:Ca2+/Na+ antiporter